jgi:aspartyl-tRNA synthetase
MKRTYIEDLANKSGEVVEVFGWVNSRRDHGKIIFFDLRDSTGILQVVATPKSEESYKSANELTSEDVVRVKGIIKTRPEANINKEIPTGTVELEVDEIEVVGKSRELPLPLDSDGTDIDEVVRLRYRYLDLRRVRLQKNLRVRHQMGSVIREFLNDKGFIEIETPYLSKTTPEGARDFLVPSRLQKGKFYALAQSPQQYKQLLMIAGFDKYYQFPRAFRDEDLRADRQFEHTQVDLEMAFVDREQILNLIEELFKKIADRFNKKITKLPIPRYSHSEVLEKFGADKFDNRKDKGSSDELALAFVTDFPLFEYDDKEKRWTFSHNPFTAPKPEDVENLKSNKEIGKIGSLQYDLVCNGLEIASGSIRINDPNLQREVFKIMGYTEKQINSDFGHILEAYEYGAPLHGGVALGFDRLVAIISGEKSIREVIAFPVSSGGQTSVMEAPNEVSENTLKDLGLSKTARKE